VEPGTAVAGGSGTAGSGSGAATPDRLTKRDRLDPGEAPPFDADAT
jgi:sec-independent protein translocase protein TatB